MIHTTRRYHVADVLDAPALATMLVHGSWTLCSAFRLRTDGRELLFLNDAFSEDGAQEYTAVCGGREVESITFSWCTPATAETHIATLLTGPHTDYGPITNRMDEADAAHTCRLCR